MAIPSYFKRLFREYVTGVGSSEVAAQAPVQSSSDVNHDQTSNRTHDGDDLSPATLEAGGADTRFDWINETESGIVPAGNFAPIWTTTLADGETLNVTQAALSLNDGTATPTDCDLVIADLTNMSEESELITSDGTLQIDATGTPLGSYTNTTGASEQVAVGINNGEFGQAGSGTDQNARGSFIGRVV